jgi:uncharacterized protein YidB (DUF937 family)
LGAGLKDLLDRFRQSGQEDKGQSWVAKGSNKPIAPQELGQTLGEERIQWLMEQTRLPRDELLSGLSNELPDAIDKLTTGSSADGRRVLTSELTRAAERHALAAQASACSRDHLNGLTRMRI